MNRNAKVNRFIKTLEARSVTIALAESMTCGLAAHLLSTCKGTSNVLMGSIVCYNAKTKTSILGVGEGMIQKHTAESREVTGKLAHGLKRHIKADVYAAITGLAAPGGSERPGKPVGTVFYAVLFRGKLHTFRRLIRGTPLRRREKACLYLYDLILAIITKTSETAGRRGALTPKRRVR
jgi:PncC family amidohydrolase